MPAGTDLAGGTSTLCHNAGCTVVRLDEQLAVDAYLQNGQAGTPTFTVAQDRLVVVAESPGPRAGDDAAGAHRYRLELRDADDVVVFDRKWDATFESRYSQGAGCQTCWAATAELTEANALAAR